jgi:hypothetical protein
MGSATKLHGLSLDGRPTYNEARSQARSPSPLRGFTARCLRAHSLKPAPLSPPGAGMKGKTWAWVGSRRGRPRKASHVTESRRLRLV